jgi:hypothetical protein
MLPRGWLIHPGPALLLIPRLRRPKGSGQVATQHDDLIDFLALGATGQAEGVPVALQAAEAKPLVPQAAGHG